MSPQDTLSAPPLVVKELTMAYGHTVIQKDLNFTVKKSDIFIIMGGSGCGKSTLLRHLIGLKRPAQGTVHFLKKDFWDATPEERAQLMRCAGVMYQYSALWSSMTLLQNVSFPLEEYTTLSASEIRELAEVKLALVGLYPFLNKYPSEVSGGMRKRAALARAMALDPILIFLDEPSSGLDPLSSRNLDELILQLRDALGATFVVVTHELDSIFAIGSNSIFLDADAKTSIASGDPRALRDYSDNPTVRAFLSRGGTK
jgi:phospholipid/cholesterol/gamma-HCH transport system ATP-binding protein